MRWTVVWMASAERKLAELWTDSEKRQAITDAVDAIESRLRTRPLEEGEQRAPPFRVTYQEPVGLLFAVAPDDRLVTVVRLWTT